MSFSIISAVLVGLTFAAIMLVSGNNLSACVGPAIGSRIISKRFGMLLGAAGFSAGLLLQGSGMTKSTGVLLPNATAELRAMALLVSIIIFIIADVVRVPMSLSMSLVGLLAGLSVAGKASANGFYVAEVASLWFAAPLISITVGFFFMRLLRRARPTNFWQRIQAYKVLLIVLSFSTAYVLGANTLGLVVATGGFDVVTVVAAVVAIFVGSFYLSGGAIRRISQEFYSMRYADALATLVTSTFLVEAATIFNIPLSNTQTTASAVFGTGISYRAKFVSLKPFLTIVAGWVVAPLLSFAIGILIGG
jgi:PiT family inorganic phosphate transporter